MLRTMVLTLSACLIFAGTAFGADLRIGVANMQQAGFQCDANQSTKKKYEADFKKEADNLNAAKAAFDKKAKDFESKSATLNSKTKEEKLTSLRKEAQEIGQKEMMFQQKVNMTQQAVSRDLAELTMKAAAEVAKDKKLDLVLASNNVLYAAKSFDVTEDMLSAMNRIWKADGSKVLGSSAASSAPAKKGKK